jgi:general secretion pathway protein G
MSDSPRQRLAAKFKRHLASQRGFTLFELVTVLVVFSTLVAVLLTRVPKYQELAEKTAMEQTAGAIRSALNIRVASYLAKDRISEIPRLAQENPMNWLVEKPYNYAGEYFDPRPGDVPVGSWYFDLKDRSLVYKVETGEYFAGDIKGRKQVRYRVVLVYNEPDSSATGVKKELGGAVLKADPYVWKST